MKAIIYTKDGRWGAATIKAGQTAETVKSRVEAAGGVVQGTGTVPGMATLEKWSSDGVAKSLLGARTEPDGYGPKGDPSWLLHMGLI